MQYIIIIIDINHANNQHHQRVSELPPVTMHVNSNRDINIEGIDISNINNTNTNLSPIGILLLVNKIIKQSIIIVINNAIPAYFDCSEPKKISLIFIVPSFIIIYILFYYHRKKNKN